MRKNKNLGAKIILFVILFLGVIFELANHFHLTYIFVDSKLGKLIPEKWVLIISFLGAMFFVASIVGLGVIGYKGLSWFMAVLTVGVSYMSYALIPASINTETMQMATLEYALVLPLIVAFTTHELSKFLGLKEITTLTQEQEIELEKIKRNQEFEEKKKQLTLAPTPLHTQQQQTTTQTVSSQKRRDIFKKYGLKIDPNNLNFQAKTTETVRKNNIGFQFQNPLTETVSKETETVSPSIIIVQKPTHGNRKQGFLITCEHCGKEAIRYHIKAKYCSDACKTAHNEKGGKL